MYVLCSSFLAGAGSRQGGLSKLHHSNDFPCNRPEADPSSTPHRPFLSYIIAALALVPIPVTGPLQPPFQTTATLANNPPPDTAVSLFFGSIPASALPRRAQHGPWSLRHLDQRFPRLSRPCAFWTPRSLLSSCSALLRPAFSVSALPFLVLGVVHGGDPIHNLHTGCSNAPRYPKPSRSLPPPIPALAHSAIRRPPEAVSGPVSYSPPVRFP